MTSPVLWQNIETRLDSSFADWRSRVDSLDALIRSWADASDGGEQRETVDCLVDGLDRERLSARKLFPEEYKGRSW